MLVWEICNNSKVIHSYPFTPLQQPFYSLGIHLNGPKIIRAYYILSAFQNRYTIQKLFQKAALKY